MQLLQRKTQNNSLLLGWGGLLIIVAARMNLQQEQDTLLSLTSCENMASNKYRKRGRVYINAN